MSYIGKCSKCEGMVMAVMDNPKHKEDTAKEVAGIIKAGYIIERKPVDVVRNLEWCTCK